MRTTAVACSIAIFASGALLVSCSLLTSFDDLVASASADAAPEGAGAEDASNVNDANPSTNDANSSQGSDASTPGAVTVVQLGTRGSTSVSFSNASTAGNLLVMMEPGLTRPNGNGWQQVTSSDNQDVMYLWPNNPGGLKSFSIPDSQPCILAEFSGVFVKSSTLIDFEKDTGGRGPNLSNISISGNAPAAQGELVLLYMDSTAGFPKPQSINGWTFLQADGSNNFAWWMISTSAAPSAATNVSPSSPTAMLMIALTTM